MATDSESTPLEPDVDKARFDSDAALAVVLMHRALADVAPLAAFGDIGDEVSLADRNRWLVGLRPGWTPEVYATITTPDEAAALHDDRDEPPSPDDATTAAETGRAAETATVVRLRRAASAALARYAA